MRDSHYIHVQDPLPHFTAVKDLSPKRGNDDYFNFNTEKDLVIATNVEWSNFNQMFN